MEYWPSTHKTDKENKADEMSPWNMIYKILGIRNGQTSEASCGDVTGWIKTLNGSGPVSLSECQPHRYSR